MEKLLFSIIIPTYNRPEKIKECLDSLTIQEYPSTKFEVIVVDDGSKISLEDIVNTYSNKLDITLIRQSNAGPATARNTGASKAKGEFLAFTDDDCIPAIDWLTNLALKLSQTPDYLIGGRTVNALPQNLYSTASQELIDYLYKYYNTSSRPLNFFASNNLALPANLFQKLGGFDTSFPLAAAEDREFCERWQYNGYKMLYAAEVKVYHAHHLTFKTFWRQHFNYGRGAFCFHKTRAQRTSEKIQVEPLSFYFNLLTYPLSQSSSQLPILLTGLFVLSQLANVSGFFWEIIRNNILTIDIQNSYQTDRNI
jgi:glycosyltransferase involved in cell wall biosynthesis